MCIATVSRARAQSISENSRPERRRNAPPRRRNRTAFHTRRRRRRECLQTLAHSSHGPPPVAPCGLPIRLPQAGRGWLAIRKQHIVRPFVNAVFSIALKNGKQSKERCHVTAA